MNRDSILSVYSDARTEYTKQLCVFLVPAYFQFYIDLLEKAKQMMMQEPKRALWQFQNYLNEVHDWNMEKVSNEIHTIQVNCGCDYLEDLLTAVFIAHTKVLTAIRLSSHQKKVEINIPKVEHFLFKVLCETSKLLWSSTYLFRDGISGMEKQQNYRTIEGLLNEGVLQAVRGLVPVKSILKDFVNMDATHDDSDEEEDKKNKKEEPPLPAVEDPEPVPAPAPVLTPAPALTPASEGAPLLTIPDPPQTIVIEDKPKVRFGLFDALFDSDHPADSDMIYDPKEEKEESSDSSVPVIQIMDEPSIPLSEEVEIESLDGKDEALDSADYEVL